MANVTIRAVVFDVGETLVDETRTWTSWADWLGIPRLTALAMLGAAIARGQHHLAPFREMRPEVDLLIRRGPWAWIQAGRADPPAAWLVIDSLQELPARLQQLARGPEA
jgi:phosphoglycolate phosphatase-like HAD superfamily hydrolase